MTPQKSLSIPQKPRYRKTIRIALQRGMPLAIVHSRASAGVNALPVTVEVHLSNGLPSFTIVGLPATAVKESRDRVRSAIINSGFDFPIIRITVNLAPADLPKQGGRFDLAIAIGILAASEQIPLSALNDYEFAGELALTGVLRPIQGALPFAICSQKARRKLFLPKENAPEAALSKSVEVFGADHLLTVCAHLTGATLLELQPRNIPAPTQSKQPLDLSDVKGQEGAKRALEIAAAGGHSLLLYGPPGTGKTMLASRLGTLLPQLAEADALETAAVYSIAGKPIDTSLWQTRPFRAPHHTASSVALVGGGNPPRPGEISLAHHGVLFLDELPEFQRSVLEALREPLEAKRVMISRASHQAEFPAHFQLIGAMNPCPCGFLGDKSGKCRCTSEQVERYHAKLSGPFLDRLDMHVEVAALPKGLLLRNEKMGESSNTIRERVIAARALQLQRAQKLNANLQGLELETHCVLSSENRAFLENALEKLGLSARAFHRVLRLARTIADLAGSDNITQMHLCEALGYRKLR